jgi:cyclophilin family peptidyl-prolyl cis-trans isomerase
MKSLLSLLLVLGLATTVFAAESPKKKTTAAKPLKDTAMQQIDAMIQKAAVDTSKSGWKTQVPRPEKVTFDPKHQYFARMVTTKGTVLIKFLPDVAPMHVTSFMYLTRLGFYDGLSFHRVITGFMAQGGDPVGNGSGGPGYEFAGEFSPNMRHDRPGLLSMANRGPGTDGSQFFLTFVPTPWLDGKHTLFGEVVEGQDVLKALEAAGSQSGSTSEPLRMEKVTIEVK